MVYSISLFLWSCLSRIRPSWVHHAVSEVRESHDCVKCCYLLFKNWVYVVLENQQHPATEDPKSACLLCRLFYYYIAGSFFLTNAEVFSVACARFPLSNQLAFYMAMSVSMLNIKEMLPKPTKSRMSEKYKDGLRQSCGASTNNEETMGSCQCQWIKTKW